MKKVDERTIPLEIYLAQTKNKKTQKVIKYKRRSRYNNPRMCCKIILGYKAGFKTHSSDNRPDVGPQPLKRRKELYDQILHLDSKVEFLSLIKKLLRKYKKETVCNDIKWAMAELISKNRGNNRYLKTKWIIETMEELKCALD